MGGLGWVWGVWGGRCGGWVRGGGVRGGEEGWGRVGVGVGRRRAILIEMMLLQYFFFEGFQYILDAGCG